MEQVTTVSDGSLALNLDELPSRPSMSLVPPPPPVGAAPVTTLAAPPADMEPQPSTVSDRVEDPADVLDDLVVRFAELHGAVLASVDGFAIARSASMDDEASHAAMLAAAVGLSHQLVAMGGGAQLRQLVVDHDRGLLLVWPIGDHRVLAVLADRIVDQRALRAAVQDGAAVLVGGGS